MNCKLYDGCLRLNRIFEKSKVSKETREQQEQEDIAARWHKVKSKC